MLPLLQSTYTHFCIMHLLLKVYYHIHQSKQRLVSRYKSVLGKFKARTKQHAIPVDRSNSLCLYSDCPLTVANPWRCVSEGCTAAVNVQCLQLVCEVLLQSILARSQEPGRWEEQW